ncbi:hypothetical protein [Moorena sp. SIO4A5]|uniref:hypothetical protein n=1 Tax=Moorena sp. SIO4A5 TaxID=2607838 RepID=UPI0013C8694E|nr:hypothetical protein [Moorena sp. SIO4A5]NEO24757.1 hypothetical protein [Moorena sp. SIO4A5]
MRYTLFFPSSLFPLPSSLFPLPSSLFPLHSSLLPAPCSLLPKNQRFVPHGYKTCYSLSFSHAIVDSTNHFFS